MKVILDACAVIAFFRNEPGSEVVEEYLLHPQSDSLIHAINMCEVYYDFWRFGGQDIAAQVVQDSRAIMDIREDFGFEFWQQAGAYKATIKRISLADCFALTLANREQGILLTSDRKEFEPVEPLNICQIQFIR